MPVGSGATERSIAFRRRAPMAGEAGLPGVVWLGGFKSDMLSTKAERLDQWAAGQGRAWGCDLSDQYIRINADYTT